MPAVMKIYQRTINEDGVSELSPPDRLFTHGWNGERLVTILYFPGNEVDNRLEYQDRINDISGTIKYAEHLLGGKDLHKNPRLQFLGISYDSWHNKNYDEGAFNKDPENYTYNEAKAMSKFLAPLYTQTDEQGNIIDRISLEEAMENMGHLVICGNSIGSIFGLEVDNAIIDRMTNLGYKPDETDQILQRKQSLFLGNVADPRFSRSTNVFIGGKNDKIAREFIPDYDALILDKTADLTISKTGKNSLLAMASVPDQTILKKPLKNGECEEVKIYDSERHHPAFFVHSDNIVSYIAKNVLTNMVKNALEGKAPEKPEDLVKDTTPLVNQKPRAAVERLYAENVANALAKNQFHKK